MGGAYLAGLAVGFWKDEEELSSAEDISAEFMPALSEDEKDERLQGWKNAVEMLL